VIDDVTVGLQICARGRC